MVSVQHNTTWIKHTGLSWTILYAMDLSFIYLAAIKQKILTRRWDVSTEFSFKNHRIHHHLLKSLSFIVSSSSNLKSLEKPTNTCIGANRAGARRFPDRWIRGACQVYFCLGTGSLGPNSFSLIKVSIILRFGWYVLRWRALPMRSWRCGHTSD